MTFNPDAAGWSADTQAVRGGLDRTGFQETSEPVFLNSGFVYESAAAAERAVAEERRAAEQREVHRVICVRQREQGRVARQEAKVRAQADR